jgi:hypothetical protein
MTAAFSEARTNILMVAIVLTVVAQCLRPALTR